MQLNIRDLQQKLDRNRVASFRQKTTNEQNRLSFFFFYCVLSALIPDQRNIRGQRKKHQLSLKIPALKKHIKYFFHHIE